MVESNIENTIRQYGSPPFRAALLHGGPGAAGEMKPIAVTLSKEFGVLEFLQTKDSIDGQIKELCEQILSSTNKPVCLIGYSWGAWLAVLFAAKYPDLIKRLILISAGSFDFAYNLDLMNIRLNRLNETERGEAERIISMINSGEITTGLFQRFGELMEEADSYKKIPDVSDDTIHLDMNIYEKVWKEADSLRKKGGLLQAIEKIKCPVVAFHGDYDPHPSEGVEIPLKQRIANSKMIKLPRCGHSPWKEEYAKDIFYKKLIEEINL